MLLKEANKVTEKWGVDVVRVEVRDILPSPEIVAAMELQMSAERHKRAAILESEGRRTAKVNAAEAGLATSNRDGIFWNSRSGFRMRPL